MNGNVQHPLARDHLTERARSALIASATVLSVLLVASCSRSSALRPQAHQGQIPAAEGFAPLAGKWEFYWREFVPPGAPRTPSFFADVPGAWKGTPVSAGMAAAKGYATYRVTIHKPVGCPCAIHLPAVGSAYRLYAGTDLIASAGEPGSTKETTRPLFRPQLSRPIPQADPIVITWHIANFRDRSGGPWFAPRFGSLEAALVYRERQVALDLFVAGGLLMMALYHAGIFLLRREDRIPLYFSIFCLLMGIRSLSEGEKYLFALLPELDWRAQVQISYATFYMAVPVFLKYFAGMFPGKAARRLLLAGGTIFGCMTAAVLFLPVSFFSETLPVAHAATAALIPACLVITGLATAQRRPEGLPFLIGVLLFGTAVLHDILLAYSLVDYAVLAPLGFFLFLFSQAFILSLRFSGALRAEEHLARELRETNHSLRRFVPSQFLQILERPDLTSVLPGDQVQRRMTVLFSDIRSFTGLSEAMTPAENFNFLNSYMKRMTPSIDSNGGFIDKFIGDGIMALFPGEPHQAIDAAISMQKEVLIFNGHRRKSGYRPIAVGIGIHVGDLILGMIGTAERLEGTVISDAVNLAARLEDLTRQFGSQIVISEDMFLSIPDPDRYRFRVLASLNVRGKSRPVTVLEILDGLSQEDRAYRMATKGDFERGCHALASGERGTAREHFERALAENPDDSAARYYVETLGGEQPPSPIPEWPETNSR